MLSRLALSRGKPAFSDIGRVLLCNARLTHHLTKKDEEVPVIKEGPERDLVNFPRRIRPINPGKVRIGFIPDEWFTFFYNKTGVTGPYVFGVSLMTFLISKEIYVLEHEYYSGLSLFLVLYAIYKYAGPDIRKYFDKEIENDENMLKKYRTDSIKANEDGIANEKNLQTILDNQKVLFDAKRENIHLQVEAAYRDRLVKAHAEVKKRLNYQLDKQNAERQFEQKHMVSWIVKSVLKGVTPQQEKDALQQCLTDLKSLSVAK